MQLESVSIFSAVLCGKVSFGSVNWHLKCFPSVSYLHFTLWEQGIQKRNLNREIHGLERKWRGVAYKNRCLVFVDMFALRICCIY